MSNKLVSIITPAYCCAATIKNTYESIRNQTYTNWEWLITEDCSNDNTLDVLKSIVERDQRIKIFENDRNLGAAVSRNKSLLHATGQFIAFIDADDLWHHSKLQKQVSFMEMNSVDFSFTAYEIIDESGSLIGKTVDTKHIEPLTYRDMLRKKATMGCSTVMLRREAFPKLSMPLIRTGQDYGLWLKLLKGGTKAYPINDILTQYRILPDSISRNKIKKAKRQWQIYREIERISFFDALICFYFYAWRAVFRK
ncbi:glycosyltransferase family 2 protein [Vibrio furnissii]|uniref:glycosyltransferase family 2 protein n=1 Tax=Vibrio furnissii TaxID=29494 RepID=UPI0013025727|nr:glycosyltransferase family 2 protein [Vibrio furnissii]